MSDVVEQVIQRHPEVKNEGIPERRDNKVPLPGELILATISLLVRPHDPRRRIQTRSGCRLTQVKCG